MAEKNPEFNPFVKDNAFPDAKTLFSNLPSLNEVFDKAIVVLDTSVLFVPYDLGKDSLDDIKNAYKELSKDKRLVIPAQVAREYAARRLEKLSEIIQAVADLKSKAKSVEGTISPMMDSLKSFQDFREHQKAANDAIKKCQDCLGEVVEAIRSWDTVDPVRSFYQEVFTSDVIVDLDGKQDDHLKEHSERLKSLIPPAFRDAKKNDKGIGDFLIWKTILQIGKKRNCPVVLVSQDHKDDWCHKAEDRLFSARAELVEEFKRESGGEPFFLISFGELLKHVDARAETIRQVKTENKVRVGRKRKMKMSPSFCRRRFSQLHHELLVCMKSGTIADALNILESSKSLLSELNLNSKYKLSKQMKIINNILLDARMDFLTLSEEDFWQTVLECFDGIAKTLRNLD